MRTEKASREVLTALEHACATLAAQQEAERLLTAALDEKPPANWRDLAKGALTS